jgi:hypothetical protein
MNEQTRADLRFLRKVAIRLLMAAFFAAVWYWFNTHHDSFKPESDTNFAVGFGVFAGWTLAGALAIGSLFGKWGLVAGAVLAALYLAYLIIAVMVVGI